jgi:predicted amidohydrolase YtcJ
VAFAARDGYDHCRRFTCEERHIKDVVPAMTMVGGEIVFARDDGDGGKAT